MFINEWMDKSQISPWSVPCAPSSLTFPPPQALPHALTRLKTWSVPTHGAFSCLCVVVYAVSSACIAFPIPGCVNHLSRFNSNFTLLARPFLVDFTVLLRTLDQYVHISMEALIISFFTYLLIFSSTNIKHSSWQRVDNQQVFEGMYECVQMWVNKWSRG